MYDFLIIGAGLSGSIIARELANNNKNVLVLERRSHISGNLYDELNENNILIQKYGPHIFHTNSNTVYEYINKYSNWIPYKLKCEVYMNGFFTPSPFNFKTIDTFYSTEKATIIKKALLSTYTSDTVPIVDLLKSEDINIREYAEMLYEYDYSLYTSKQWGIKPADIDISVLKRVPVRLDYKEMYFTDKFECLPKDGYTNFIKNILNHKNITVLLENNGISSLVFNKSNIEINNFPVSSQIKIIYTGAIDELFDYKFGMLPYRSLDFIYKTLPQNSFQNVPVVAYPQANGYTRITEYKKLPVQNVSNLTTIAYEYPKNYINDGNTERYYPIPTDKNTELYRKYFDFSSKFSNLYLCGRLAEYKYYNMDQIVEKALTLSSILKKQ